jgi:hypothetical protein
VSGVIAPSSSPAAAITILNVLPGAYWPWITRFMSGVSGSVVSSDHSERSMPAEKRFGS